MLIGNVISGVFPADLQIGPAGETKPADSEEIDDQTEVEPEAGESGFRPINIRTALNCIGLGNAWAGLFQAEAQAWIYINLISIK